ncbi:VWA domain-containing protein [Corynebacterium halotolerans]|uniref:von Willebrand factor type A n=1 Tax=Corynebacterium halotolerans YIM 70093 = DSM 44683 TaxID=1121362 RepID=M1NX19_9CORY|nr:VWA domain-containing protein [Corynebacterium halotolerans]AGF72030.1 von Willebrand factor type A [Corynebacterium halotolerans YIM 70093 = DSM 44683]
MPHSPGHRRSRYGRYTGGPDPLAPPVDLAEALDAIAEEVMAGYSPEQALREYLRRGGRGREGYDDLARRVAERRRELLQRHNLGGTLRDIKKLLDDAVLDERKQLARDVTMDDTDRAFREMQMDNLPTSTAAAVNELSGYDWQSTDAREKFEQIKDLLGREMLDQQFSGMKQALEGATDEDRAAIREMLTDLNELLEKHRRGEDTDEDFAEFMARHGDQFPENPRNIDELIDALAQRSAAAQRMLNSMTEEQRRELMELSAQAFGSPELMDQLGALAGNLQAMRPDLDWSGSEDFSGEQGLGLGDGTGAVQDIAELDALSEQLSQAYSGARPSDIDLEAINRQLGDEASVSAETLAQLERAMRESGLLRNGADGSLRLSPQAMRRLGKTLLNDAAKNLTARSGARDAQLAGASGEQTGATRPWEFGDTQPWDVTRTVTNALQRTAAEGSDASNRLRIEVRDVEVVETEARTQSAVALLVDTSFSMAAEGRWVPMKRTALALHHLVSTRFRGDELALISFGRLAMNMGIDELTALPPVHEQGTNLHHGLLLAERFFARHPSMDPTLLIVTDGEPTAHLEEQGHSWFDWPTHPETLRRTVTQLDRVTRRGARTTFFRLGDDPGLKNFLDQLADRVGGRVTAPDLDDLGAAVVGEYLRFRESGYGEVDWG